MSIELKVPAVGESITEVEIGDWLKREGDFVNKDENIAVLESEKATVEFPSPAAGTLGKILKKKGETAKVGEVIAQLEPGQANATKQSAADVSPAEDGAKKSSAEKASEKRVMPAAQRVMAERGLKPEAVEATGPGGRILKEDVMRVSGDQGQTQIFERPKKSAATAPSAEAESDVSSKTAGETPSVFSNGGQRQEQTIRMTKLRRTIASRLVEAQHNAALLTTFNEIDMTNVMAMRKEFGEVFLKRHSVKLGFMSFFVKAAIDGLKQIPQINAEIRGEDVVYKNYFDIGIAVGTERGLVVAYSAQCGEAELCGN
jgi:2-oxoglutarate dehydrogenase E2 component (dihydrolipoamide succinyltransferase)